ncbi:MAG: metallophosphoesterase [Planctomycetia bacterium]
MNRLTHGLRSRVSRAAWLAALLAASGAPAHDDPGDHEEKSVVYTAANHPDRVVLTIAGDPATTQAATWRTSAAVGRGFGQIALAAPGPQFVVDVKTVPARTERLETDVGAVHYHSVLFEKLSPKTKYAYRVGADGWWSEWFHFETAAAGPEPFSFIYFGDAQNDIRQHWSRVVREAYRDAPTAKLFLHAGDLINRGDADGEWGEWHAAGGFLNAMTNTLATPGNHEYSSKTGKQLSKYWRPQFAFPENGTPGLEETVYRVDYQGVRFLSLDSNVALDAQTVWLKQQLTDNPCRWTIATFHHPIFSSARGRDNAVLRKTLKPLFDEYRVDLVLQGHDHTYYRSGLEVPDNVPAGVQTQSPTAGTVYVVSVSGPKMYDLAKQSFMKRAAMGVQLYQIISVDGDRLTYTARTADGRPYDGFELRKRAGRTNELIEQVPDVPERLERPSLPKPKKPAA